MLLPKVEPEAPDITSADAKPSLTGGSAVATEYDASAMAPLLAALCFDGNCGVMTAAFAWDAKAKKTITADNMSALLPRIDTGVPLRTVRGPQDVPTSRAPLSQADPDTVT
jgi:hypothetical protein